MTMADGDARLKQMDSYGTAKHKKRPKIVFFFKKQKAISVPRQPRQKPSRSGPKKKNMGPVWIFAYKSQIIPRIQIYNFFLRFHCQKKMAPYFLQNDDNMQMR